MTKAQNNATYKYRLKAYDRINVLIPKGRLDDIKSYMDTHNITVNAFINNALRNALGMSETEWKAKPTDSLDIDSQDNSD